MPVHPDVCFSALIGFIVTFGTSVLIVSTKPWHGEFTFDGLRGLQKVHKTLVPRIGGLTIFTGFWAAASTTTSPMREILFALGISGSAAFLTGLAEDIFKRISVMLRSFGMILSGLFFCLLTDYSVTRVEIPLFDNILEFHSVSIAFTVIAVAGVANAVNLIDGFHGLAAGSVIIMFSSTAVVASFVGDHDLAMLAIVIVGVLAGFLLVNFPFGYVFMGDGGAYFAGFLLASLAVMLSVRNPEISPWIGILILIYPVLETLCSVIRKTIYKGITPTTPDEWHLHMLVYRFYGKRLGEAMGNKQFSNPITSILIWGWVMIGLVFVFVIPYSREWLIFGFSLQAALYLLVYWSLLTIERR